MIKDSEIVVTQTSVKPWLSALAVLPPCESIGDSLFTMGSQLTVLSALKKLLASVETGILIARPIQLRIDTNSRVFDLA